MKALVYTGPGKISWEEKTKPSIENPKDALIRILKTTICGTDLHILKGDVPTVSPGTILGHEGVGVVVEIGKQVTKFKPGDHVLISCITSCGQCEMCKKGMYSHCENGGWLLGNKINGTQAEFVRIPHADNSLYRIPSSADEEAMVLLSDILPTGFECGVINGQIKPGSTVAIVGSGPIGLATLLTAQLFSPSQIIMIDIDDNRLVNALNLGATAAINSKNEKVTDVIMKLTAGKGVDTAIEAVGIPSTFELCTEIVTAGGVVANVGVHGKCVDLHLETLWSKNITITTRLVDTVTTPTLQKMVLTNKLKPKSLITHHFSLDDVENAYQTFANAAAKKVLKVILTNHSIDDATSV